MVLSIERNMNNEMNIKCVFFNCVFDSLIKEFYKIVYQIVVSIFCRRLLRSVEATLRKHRNEK